MTAIYKTPKTRYDDMLADKENTLIDGVVLEDAIQSVLSSLEEINDLDKQDLEDEDDSTTIDYYADDLYYLAGVAVIKFDRWLREHHKTADDIFAWFDEKAGSNISLERVQCRNMSHTDDMEHTELMMEICDQYGYLIASGMIGSGVGMFELFDIDTPDLLSIT